MYMYIILHNPSAMLIKANMLTKYPDQITIKVMITDCTAFNHF